ncbi:hypothetical protein BDP55DRAFT_687326 [Colletotrichum godetiae]|uniref:HD domain-containing protein n=1 Tax=Colletotrichum godetiae TaxID=1209918 RepID=A0AAJ0EPZ8_9PEZI|nr:uncharacterized protein BDP55DRAFT_687326 [Colletotrichum godetiae]KAK1656973.1 hypothetical protein BDP55DRAFT_687326 [Colletotrichum godetiae]
MDDFQTSLAKSPLPFLYQLGSLKRTPRTGWLRFVPNCESVASHSWRLAAMALFAPEPLDRMRCMYIGLVHDMAESYTGDIPKFAEIPKAEKRKLETRGFEWIERLLEPGYPELADELKNAWLDYEEGRTEEGRWMKQMDKLECLIQAKEYEEQTFGAEKGLEEFQSLRKQLQAPEAKHWDALVQREREAHFSKRKQQLPLIFVMGSVDHVGELCTLQARKDGFHQVCFDNALTRKSEDNTFVHAHFLKTCLAEGFEVPSTLAVEILEESIREVVGEGSSSWTLVQGFPKTLEQLQEFERKVQETYCSIYVKPSLACESDKPSKEAKWRMNVTPESYLKSITGCYEEVSEKKKHIGRAVTYLYSRYPP